MANRDVLTRSGVGALLTIAQHDQNLNSLASTVDAKSGTTYTVVYTDQNKTIELNNATMTCTVDAIATIVAAMDTDSWQVTIKNINSAAATIARSSTDTFDGATSLTLKQYEAVTLQINGAGTGWSIIKNKSETFASIDVNGGAIDGTPIGGTTAAAGTFTTLTANTSLVINGSAAMTAIETTLAGSATKLARADAIKAYSDSKISTDPSGTGTLSTGGTMEVFVSTATTYTAAGQVLTPQAHGLSGTPHEVIAYVECISAEHGYSIGDRAMVNLVDNANGFIHGIMSWCDGTYIGGGVLNSGISLRHKTTVGSSNVVLSTSSWEIYVVAKYYT